MKTEAMRLVGKKRMELTPAEQRLYSLLPPTRKTDTKSLAKSYFNNKIPYHGQKIISGMVRALALKGYVRRGERDGPHAMEVWKA